MGFSSSLSLLYYRFQILTLHFIFDLHFDSRRLDGAIGLWRSRTSNSVGLMRNSLWQIEWPMVLPHSLDKRTWKGCATSRLPSRLLNLVMLCVRRPYSLSFSLDLSVVFINVPAH